MNSPQEACVRRALQLARRAGASALDVRLEVEAGVNAVRARFADTAWQSCSSWYRTPDGRDVANWPGCMREYADPTREPAPADFRFVRAG